MPPDNRFRHQEYRAGPPAVPVHLLRAEAGPPVGTDEWGRRMRAAGEALSVAGAAAILLVHGTFVGDDALGLVGELSRAAPDAGRRLRRLQKGIVDRVARDSGNYTEAFARELERGLSVLPVRLLHWSGENHHIGRAHGAVALLDALSELDARPGQRILVWAHSHGGNVLALATNLLAGDPGSRERFFRAARSYYRRPLSGRVDLPVWRRVRSALRRADGPLSRIVLDAVTFGTPVRYGWDSGGYGRLLHLVHHRPQPGLDPHRAPFPPPPEQARCGAGGDYVQSLGVAGTNFPPPLLAWRSWIADRRLHRLLQRGIRRRDLLSRLRSGLRVPQDGRTLLVDYGDPVGRALEQVAGHAVYTRPGWMLFHAEQAVLRLYGGAS